LLEVLAANGVVRTQEHKKGDVVVTISHGDAHPGGGS
jgi:hypothetical protein